MGGLEPVYQVELLAALQSDALTVVVCGYTLTMDLGDPALIHTFWSEIGKYRREPLEYSAGGIDPAAAALNLAVRCASSKSSYSKTTTDHCLLLPQYQQFN
jgi:hypothetical protein